MSILIKGMDMPKNCNECPLHFYEGQAICCCRALPAIEDDEILKPWKNKRKDCPLVEIPVPHGRLGDLDALVSYFKNSLPQAVEGENEFVKCLIKAAVIGFIEDLRNTPTVLEAEGKDDG